MCTWYDRRARHGVASQRTRSSSEVDLTALDELLVSADGGPARAVELAKLMLSCHDGDNERLGWWRFWLRHDPSGAVAFLVSQPSSGPWLAHVATFSRLLNDGVPESLDSLANDELADLAEWTTRVVDPDDDESHPTMGIRSITPRSEAESGRGAVMNALYGRAELNARSTLGARLAFSCQRRPELVARVFKTMHDSAIEVTNDASVDLLAIEQEAVLPNSEKSLHRFLLHDLQDIAEQLTDGESSTSDLLVRATARMVDEQRTEAEAMMQRWFADQLKVRGRGAYDVVREKELANRRMPDLTANVKQGGGEVRVEVKIAEGWPWNDLREALLVQLNEGYLSTTACRHGILVLVNLRKRKNGWRHHDGIITFDGLIPALQAVADEDPSLAVARVVGVDATLEASAVTRGARTSRLPGGEP